MTKGSGAKAPFSLTHPSLPPHVGLDGIRYDTVYEDYLSCRVFHRNVLRE